MNVSDIRIPASFARTTPREEKIERCREFFRSNGRLDRDIIIGRNGQLCDGYIGYLVLVENGVTEVEVVQRSRKRAPVDNSYRNKPTVYVFGRHNTSLKEYCWRVTKSTHGMEYLKIGNKAVVKTRSGNSIATIIRIEELSTPPVNMAVRRVIECLDE